MSEKSGGGLREQTTEALKRHSWWLAGNLGVPGMLDHTTYKCLCGWSGPEPAEHVADAVVEALGLTEEWGVQRALCASATPRESESWCKERAEFLNDRYGPGEASVVRRWVSGWSVVDGDPK